MEIAESYRVLELEIGAPRAAVDAAYCRLVERWHPDRAAEGGAEAIREAQRMVQTINEAYHTLAKISPNSIKTSAPELAPNAALKTSEQTIAPTPPSAPVVKSKPKLPPLVGGQPSLGRSTPPPPPPSPDTWASRPTASASASPAPISTPPAAPPIASAPPPTKSLPPTPPPPTSTPPAVSAPPSAPTSTQVKLVPEVSVVPEAAPSGPRKVPGLYDMLFPLNSPLRRFAPGILIAAVILLLLLGKCALSSSSRSSSAASKSAPDPKTTGRLIVKSNRANATVEARRLPSPDDATTANADGSIEQLLSGLPPGKYAVTAHADGWPDVHAEATIEIEHTTEVALNFKSGSLHLDSDPAGATVRLGSAILGRTPLVVPQLPPGECLLSVEYPSWPAVQFKTTIVENGEATGLVRLPYGKLIVETSLPGASILLAGRPLGLTPLTVDRFPAGTRKLTLQAKDFPAQEIPVTMEDHGEVKIHPVLGAAFPVLDPAVLLRAVWTRDDPDRAAPPLEGVTGPFQSRNGIVKNLNRKWLFETWMTKRYRFTGTIKSYDPANGQIEFIEQQSELSKYRILAILSAEARNDPAVIAQLGKGATFAFYGRLTAVEEPRWPSKVISFELSSSEPLR